MKEAQENLFRFEDIDSDVFSAFVQWIYTSELFLGEPITSPIAQLLLKEDSPDENDGIDAESEGSDFDIESEPDEEYDEGPDTVPDEGPGTDSNGRSDAGEASSEQKAIWYHLSFDGDSSELNVYQLQVLLKLCNNVHLEEELGEFREKWEQLLEEKQKESELDPDAPDNYEHKSVFAQLIDIYILADRFTVPALRIKAINRLQHERDLRQRLRWLDRLPAFEDVSRAFENLPEASPLRAWLIHVFAYDWNPMADNAEQMAARKQPPKDFVMEMMLLNTSRLNYGGQMDVDVFRFDLCFYHEHQAWDEIIACRKERGRAPGGGVVGVEDFEDDADE